MNWFPKSPLWYFLFPLNRLLPKYISEFPTYSVALDNSRLILDESYLALFIFLVTLLWYLHFAIGTIKQICNACDIWCLSIKPENLKTKGKV